MAAMIFTGDVGTALRCTVKDEDDATVNVSTATVKRIKLEDPDGTVVTKTASFYTDGSDGKIQYVTTATDLHTAGEWKLYGYVEVGSGAWHTDPERITVHQAPS
jgi:hypothetical protein